MTFTTWSGGIVNYNGLNTGTGFVAGTFLVVWGQGHGDGGDNAYYAFGPIESATPAWYRPRNSTVPNPVNVSQDGSGNPVARHTSNSIAYMPTRNKMITIGGWGRHSDAGDSSLAHVLDFAQANPNSSLPWASLGSTTTTIWLACYDAGLDQVFGPDIGSSNTLHMYNVATATSSDRTFGSTSWGMVTGSACANDDLDSIAAFWSVNASVLFYDRRNGLANDYYFPTVSGTPMPNGTAAGMCWDSSRKRFVFWQSGKTLWFLTRPATNPYAGGNAWVWSSTTPGSGSTPDAAQVNGTYGRFGYSPNAAVEGYTLVNSSSGSVYFFKP